MWVGFRHCEISEKKHLKFEFFPIFSGHFRPSGRLLKGGEARREHGKLFRRQIKIPQADILSVI